MQTCGDGQYLIHINLSSTTANDGVNNTMSFSSLIGVGVTRNHHIDSTSPANSVVLVQIGEKVEYEGNDTVVGL